MPPKRNNAGLAKQVPNKRRRLSAGSSLFRGRGRADDNYQPRQTRSLAALHGGSPLLFLDDNSVPRVAPQQASRPSPAHVVYAPESSAESEIQVLIDHDDEEDATPPLSPDDPRRHIRSGAPSPEEHRPQPAPNTMPMNPPVLTTHSPAPGANLPVVAPTVAYTIQTIPTAVPVPAVPVPEVPLLGRERRQLSSRAIQVAGRQPTVGRPFSSDATTLVKTEGSDKPKISSSNPNGSDEKPSISSSESPERGGEPEQPSNPLRLPPPWLGSWTEFLSVGEEASRSRPNTTTTTTITNNNNPPSTPDQPHTPRAPHQLVAPSPRLQPQQRLRASKPNSRSSPHIDADTPPFMRYQPGVFAAAQHLAPPSSESSSMRLPPATPTPTPTTHTPASCCVTIWSHADDSAGHAGSARANRQRRASSNGNRIETANAIRGWPIRNGSLDREAI
ncbi:predicted protein [Chaetomium globosum CBS 148.51]|uniref:Uncharacterized protein n=1 Tax=Chaetomium globosum (strain ATCC 6205 / CBS 148.51 / DSM 1962 / NBRC 6347 / NRRL 1970) TaxID=306901 RepID=Q2H1K2_CHAGB|nr:uncharacterized protein CHGG_04344 [Chaetomium globosum CBS 148.51]EAQ87725.1 predicted protein [Chaetomium globosum CBS 148.51]